MNGSLRLAVTGNPVMQSLSPPIFRRIFSEKGIMGFYTRIIADTFDEALTAAGIAGISGLNITSPYKGDVPSYSDLCDNDVKLLGAANTLVFGDGISESHNTDYRGVISPLIERGINPSGKTAVVIGAGGAGVAACYGLSSIGYSVILVNRTLSKAEERIREIKNCRALKLDRIDEVIKTSSVIVHTLPVADIFFNPDNLPEDIVLFDANYKYSPLKRIAAEKGLMYIDGKEWLTGQAIACFSLFSQTPQDKSLTGLFSENPLEGPCFDNISLIGFMGSGKSLSGRFLAEMTGGEFVDTDSVIEKKAGIPVKDIFEKNGEAYFRKMEKDIVMNILNTGNKKIISCGGGVVLDSGIREKLMEKSLPVWLLCSPEESLRRIGDNSRPLLNTEKRKDNSIRIFKERIDLYGSTSELVIGTDSRGGEKTARRIYEEISGFF